MTTRGRHTYGFLIVLTLTCSACGGDDKGSEPDMTALTSSDLGADLSASNGCAQTATWPNTQVVGRIIPNPYAGYDAETLLYGYRMNGGYTDTLGVAVWHMEGTTNAFPKSYSLSATGSFSSCDHCVFADVGFDSLGKGGSRYFARAGMITITSADTAPTGGMMKVSGSTLHLVEWDNAADAPLANGKCMDVGSFDFTATYPAATNDGGA
jgi:hypothetical protein